MKKIFLFIPNYVYVTDILRSNFLHILSKDFKVLVYLPTLDYVDRLPIYPNVEYRQWNLSSYRFWGYMKTLRLGMINAFDNLLSIQIHYITSFKDWRRKILRIISRKLPFRITTHMFTTLETLFLKMRKDFSDAVNKDKPSLILVCTPGFTDLEAEVIILAKKIKIKTAAINFSWDNLTTNAKHLRATDYLIVWNNYIKDEAILYHQFKPDSVFVSGSMRFDVYFLNKDKIITKEQFLKEKGLNTNLPLITITTTSHGVYPYHSDLIKMILELRGVNKVPYFSLLVRIHPKDDIKHYSAFINTKDTRFELAGHVRKMTGDSRHKIEMENIDIKNLYYTLKFSDLIINYSSTITLEALACGTPVINIAFPKEMARRHYEFSHYLPIVNSGAVPLAHSINELNTTISNYLLNRDINLEQRKELVSSFFYKTDGASSVRCAQIVESILLEL
jgi:hypothetical protein